ncbi:hypothetical protein PR048_024471 [Dryococelus australis]|uniref:Uncharacterized protein n=1 Tax=Dryococelus australis TaxID=614101 RepID=A0ABQ9GNQ3_9NEOP|nr:hypothetical protein PR048_024471 [Dryococelus australis]
MHTNHKGSVSELRNPGWLGRMRKHRQQTMEVRQQPRVIEVSVDQPRNERAGQTGNPRENPPTNDIVRHNSHMRISGIPDGEVPTGDKYGTTSHQSLPTLLGRISLSAPVKMQAGTDKPNPKHKHTRTSAAFAVWIAVYLKHPQVNSEPMTDLPWVRTLRGAVRLSGSRRPSSWASDGVAARQQSAEDTAQRRRQRVRAFRHETLEPIADLQGNEYQIPYCQVCGNTGTAAKEKKNLRFDCTKGLWSLAYGSLDSRNFPISSYGQWPTTDIIAPMRIKQGRSNVALQRTSRIRQQDGVACHQGVGTPFVNQRLVTYTPAGSPASKKASAAYIIQSVETCKNAKPVMRNSEQYWTPLHMNITAAVRLLMKSELSNRKVGCLLIKQLSRKICPETWKRNVAKRARHRPKCLPKKPTCEHGNKGYFRCKDLYLQDIRRIRQKFYQQPDHEWQNNFLLQHVSVVTPKRRCTSAGSTPTGENRDGVRRSQKYELKREAVKNHIKTFKPLQSHYRRGKHAKRQYLPSDLSVQKCGPCIQSTAQKICVSNMTITEPFSVKNSISVSEVLVRTSAPHVANLKARFQLREKYFTRNYVTRWKATLLLVTTVKKKKPPALPNIPDQATYYTRRLYLYNFILCQGSSESSQTKDTTFCYVWTENEFSKGSNQIASAVRHRLIDTNTDMATTVRLFPDG